VPNAGEPANRRVLVAGGGPAGLEAARVAALRGFEVVLAERAGELGGLAREAALRMPNAPGMREGTDWLEREVRRLGVDVRLGQVVDVDFARDVGADVVLVATGGVARHDGVQSARPGQLPYGLDRPGVVTPMQALALTAEQAGSAAVVVDDIGDYAAIGISEYLVSLGVDVTVVTPFFSLASPLDATFRPLPALSRLARGGRFRVRPTSLLAGVDASGAVVTYLPTSTDETIPADTVVLVTRMRPDNALVAELEQAGLPAVAIGDAATPRNFRSAIADGYRWESIAPSK
ncbi:MAG TPA: FAD-dependent oxidoreductase, partial [Jatrophihabitantaceae bacterium]|nr:FAD-dependent oxidoreductase [Jatrophihabitantaceae bacterium]